MVRLFFLALRSTCKQLKLELGFSSKQELQHLGAQSTAVKNCSHVSGMGLVLLQECKLFVNKMYKCKYLFG